MLGDDLDAALPELQAQADSTMTTPCRVRRGATVAAGANGEDVLTGGTTIFDAWSTLPGCNVAAKNLQPLAAESASSTVVVQQLEIHLPATAPTFTTGDVVETPDGLYRVLAGHRSTRQTAQRLPVAALS